MTLEATTALIRAKGSLTLEAGAGIVILEHITAESDGNSPLVLNSDTDSQWPNGALTIYANKTVNSFNSHVTITAWDVLLDGSLNAGTGAARIHGAMRDQTIGIGNTAKNLHITDAELGRITCRGGLTVGSSTNAQVTVQGVTDSNSDSIGQVTTLIATGTDLHRSLSRTVLFSQPPSTFNKGLTLLGYQGVVINTDLTTHQQPFRANGGIGAVTVAWTKNLVTSNQAVYVTADDVDFDGYVSTGSGAVSVNCYTGGRLVGIGAYAQQLTLSGGEIQRMEITGLMVGGGQCGSQLVYDVTASNTRNLEDVVTLFANRDDAQVEFTSYGSTFNALRVSADNGVILKADVTATGGSMLLDGDVENSSTEDTNWVHAELSRTIKTKTVLTLKSSAGSINEAGDLTFQAGDGIQMQDNLIGYYGGHQLVLNADYEDAGDGTITVQAGKTVSSNNGPIIITAWDVDFDGGISAGTNMDRNFFIGQRVEPSVTGTVSGAYSNTIEYYAGAHMATVKLHGSKIDQTIGVGGGSAVGQMFISDAELSRITSYAGLYIGSSSNKFVEVDGVTDASTDELGRMHLIATNANLTVTYKGAPSSFNKGITVQASEGVVLSTSLTTKNTATKLAAGTSFVTVVATKTLSTTDQLLVITADDYDISGEVNTGAGAGKFETTSELSIGVGTGAGVEQVTFSPVELQRITGTGLTIGALFRNETTQIAALGGARSSNIHVVGIQKVNTATIGGVVSFVTSMDDAYVKFDTSPSTFNAISAQADNAVYVDVDITAMTGGIWLDGDLENSSTADQEITLLFTDQRVLTAKTVITLESTTGRMEHHARLTLEAGNGIVLNTNASSTVPNQVLVMNADTDSGNGNYGVGNGTVTIGPGKAFGTSDGDIYVTANDLDFDGILRSGSGDVSIHGSTPTHTFDFDGILRSGSGDVSIHGSTP